MCAVRRDRPTPSHTAAPGLPPQPYLLARRAVLLLNVIVVLWAAPVLAQDTSPTAHEVLDDGSILVPIAQEDPPPQKTTPHTTPHDTQATVTLVLGVLIAFMLPLLLWLLHTLYQRRPTPRAQRNASTNTPRPPAAAAQPNSYTSGASWARASVSTSLSTDASGGTTNVETPTQAVIGFDTPTGLDSLEQDSPPTDRLDIGITGRTCPSCSRIYEIGVEFCLYDGVPLEPTEDNIPTVDPTEHTMVCTVCDKIYEPGSVFCPDDGARLRPEDPDVPSFVPVPVVICSTCQREYPVGLHRCPEDDTLLLPLVGRRTSGIPLTHGSGPRSKICPECSARYSEEAQFCGKDGLRLVRLN